MYLGKHVRTVHVPTREERIQRLGEQIGEKDEQDDAPAVTPVMACAGDYGDGSGG